jgi:hypothetical protein
MNDHHSAQVNIDLHLAGRVLSIHELGPDFCTIRERDVPAADISPCEGEISMSIDGKLKRWRIHLPEGIRAGHPEMRIVALADDKKVTWEEIFATKLIVGSAVPDQNEDDDEETGDDFLF